MKHKLNIGALLLSILVGLAVVLFFSWVSGNLYVTPLFPTMAYLSGYIITGFIIGIWTKEITITEPGLGSIIVAALTFFIIPKLGLKGFNSLWESDWFLLMLNSIVLTFVGSWLGEKFQHGEVDSKKSTTSSIDWSWIVAGTVAGVTVTLIMVNLLDLVLGHNPELFFIPYFIALMFTGLIVGYKSPGITIKEAAIAGILTITVGFDIVRLTLYLENEIGMLYILLGLVIGFVVTLLGGYIGEKLQAA